MYQDIDMMSIDELIKEIYKMESLLKILESFEILVAIDELVSGKQSRCNDWMSQDW